MSGECFRYCRLKKDVIVTEKEENIYQELLLVIISEVKLWWFENENINEWIVNFNGIKNAIELQVRGKKDLEKRIILPIELNQTLNIEWKYSSSFDDPKFKIATKIINILIKSDLKSFIEDLEEDNIESESELNDYYYNYHENGSENENESEEEYQFKEFCHSTNGIPDSCWSTNGLYGGYDDWEDYRDANGLD